MQCLSCGFENPEGMKFCGECAAPLKHHCPQCGFENPPGFKFCGACATPLSAPGAHGLRRTATRQPAKQTTKSAKRGRGKAQQPKTERSRREVNHGAPEAERRQLTVMFCDLVGSTALSERLDPEEWREVVRTYHRVSAEAIDHFEGHIAQHLGDGLLVYFGYPTAHEDDAQRAVQAGLGIVEAIHHAPLLTAQGVQVRLGIHTGLVVIGEIGTGGKREELALGDPPNIAARLQGLAEPNTVVVSATTQRLILGLFDCQDLGRQGVKGVSAPLQVYRVLSESSAQSRLEVDVSTGKLTPLVGRANEVGLILERWAVAQAGDGQVVLLSGEPGIGKSRLVQEVKERLIQQEATCLEFRCSPYSQNSAFSPVLAHLQRVLHFERDDLPQGKLTKLQQTLTRYHFPQTDTLSLLAALLSLPHPEGAPPLTLSPQKQKQKTQEALVAWLMEEAERQPVYCVWEDLHWADPSTLELLGLLLDQVPTARLLALLTARPEFTPPWSSRTHLTPLSLSRLPRTQAVELIDKVTGGKPLPTEVQHQIINKTDGVPLFVEELTKMVLESLGSVESIGSVGSHGHTSVTLGIPSTLKDALMARLDRLAMAKEVAQLGATLGREFPYELIHAVAPGDEGSLQLALAKLVEAEVLYQRGLPPQTRYVFKHALIQDAAYQSLLKSKRQQYHQQIAQVLEGRFPEVKETQPELLAHHATEAGLIGQAILYWQQAGQRAIERSANEEAINHLTRGLGLLKTLPDTHERTQQELMVQVALGPALMAVKGYAAPEVERTYTRARELCRQVGETPQLFLVLRGLWLFSLLRAELQTAREVGEQLLNLAHTVQDSALLVEAHQALGATLYFLGELIPARRHMEQSMALYDPQQHRTLAFRYEQDPGVHCLSFAARALWLLGYPDQAFKTIGKALSLAQELSHPHSLSVALVFSAALYHYCREAQLAQEQVETLIALSTAYGFAQPLAQAIVLRGWVLTEQGQIEEGISQIRQGLTAWQDTGAALLQPYYLALLAEAYGKAEQPEEGLGVLTEALAQVRETEVRFYEAELYRLKGELTLQKFQVSSSKFQVPPNPQPLTFNPQAEAEAEACFLKAIEIAQRQSAKSLELRAVMSLARLWQQQGKKEEARQMLAEIYGWFTEGFDTKDLQEAKALLEALQR